MPSRVCFFNFSYVMHTYKSRDLLTFSSTTWNFAGFGEQLPSTPRRVQPASTVLSPEHAIPTVEDDGLIDLSDDRPSTNQNLSAPIFRDLYNASPEPSTKPSLQVPASPDSGFSVSPSPEPTASNSHSSSNRRNTWVLSNPVSIGNRPVRPSSSGPNSSGVSISLASLQREASVALKELIASQENTSEPSEGNSLESSQRNISQSSSRNISEPSQGIVPELSLGNTSDPSHENVPELKVYTPYDPNDEGLPNGKFFDSQFQMSLKTGTSIARDISTVLGGRIPSSSRPDDIKGLKDRAIECAEFRGDVETIVGIIGDSGQGKSTLVNALLHSQDLAQTGATGEACTSVVTEYRHKKVNQQSPFFIEVVHLSGEEVKETVRELVWSYWRPNLIDPETEDREQQADLERFERESEIAESALRCAFGGYETFGKVIQDQSDGANKRMTDQFLEWVDDIEWPDGSDSGLWQLSIDTDVECREQVTRFMTSKLSPFTKVIRVFMSSQILKTGLVLADLPGLQDVNLARVQESERYMLKCNHIIVVANISRAASDKSLSSTLKIIAKHMPHEWEHNGGRNLNVTTVCSHCEVEDGQEKDLREKFFGKKQPGKKAEIGQLDLSIERLKSSGNRKKKKELKLSRKVMLSKARSDFVTSKLQKSYSEQFNGAHLEVFCIASAWYNKYWPKGNDNMVAASGIPALRRRCHEISSAAQYEGAKNQLLAVIPGLLNSVKLLCEAAESARAGQSIEQFDRDAIENKKKSIRDNIYDHLQEAKETFYQDIEEQIYDFVPQRSESWEQAALTEYQKWTKWHWATFDAFCRNDGTHSTRKATARWNNDLIWKMREELNFSWETLEEDAADFLDEVGETAETEFNGLKELVPAPLFAKSIDFNLAQLLHQFRRLGNQFQKEIKFIRRTASEDNSSSHVLTVMRPAYRAAAAESGTGKMRRQHARVREPIPGLFANMAILIKNDANRCVRQIFLQARRKVKETLERVEGDLQRALEGLSRINNESIPNEAVVPAETLQRWEVGLEKVRASVTGVGGDRSGSVLIPNIRNMSIS